MNQVNKKSCSSSDGTGDRGGATRGDDGNLALSLWGEEVRADHGQGVALPWDLSEDGGKHGYDSTSCGLSSGRMKQLRSGLMQVVGLPVGSLGSEQQQMEPGSDHPWVLVLVLTDLMIWTHCLN